MGSPPSEAFSDGPTELVKPDRVLLQGIIVDKQRMIDYLLAEIDDLQKRETNLMEKHQSMLDSNVHLRIDNAELRHENERLNYLLRGEEYRLAWRRGISGRLA